ncbi:type II secretion system protein GspE [Seongchinamella unica]|uniref:Type II secretion system protein E n=1 Tax=Seongchinamella unica TaxID=2547392 RepID=A0A4R5LV31_9GAMM|nr:type II secretion system ATPase GspE [Seongchinamella unica]TDG15231.1 type II secretion system protein GspE [Seongchinamella unica]
MQSDTIKEDSPPFDEDAFEKALKKQLMAANAVKEMDFARARRVHAEQIEPESLPSLLCRLGMVSEKAMAEALAATLDLELVKATDFPEDNAAGEAISPRFLIDQVILPLERDNGNLKLAMADPTQAFAIRAVAMASGARVTPCVAVRADLQQALQHLYGQQGSADEATGTDLDNISDQDVEKLRDLASEAPVIRLVNQMIQRAVDYRASDIHIEPFETQLKIRSRVDGVLRDDSSPALNMAPAIISRVKIMAGLDIAERRLPQDGRINVRVHGDELDIRVSTMPTMFGESVVMRLLHREAVSLDFDSLGFSEHQKKQMQDALAMPHGMVVVTGPTGSGKTTTLYTALHALNTEERKVITVEDPVEYNLEGINQTQVNPAIGLTFAGTLRSIVRQDPDVIMVGEMRDLETAKICVQSALTGHLVLSTLHTNDAASSITRLLEMGVEDYLLNSTVNMAMAQRLVRLLCHECRQAYTPSDGQMREFELNRYAPRDLVQLYHPKGCESCSGTGYRGRIAIVEMLQISETIRELVLQHAGAGKIERAARDDGMLTMFEDGCMKAVQGLTTIEEVVRVTQEN